VAADGLRAAGIRERRTHPERKVLVFSELKVDWKQWLVSKVEVGEMPFGLGIKTHEEWLEELDELSK
jgi:hypothetical protein